jgi:hypothetical protein
MKMPCTGLSFVVPGMLLHAYAPGIQVLRDGTSKTRMAGTSPAMTD